MAAEHQAIDRTLSRLLALAVVVYAAMAGFRTLDDPDLWWQMASGRYIMQTGHVARTEVFSYTAHGAPWTYPVGNGLLFQWLYNVGGFPLLALLSPLVGAMIALVLLRKGGVVRAWIVALAVPIYSLATLVRANMFTTLFASVSFAILWEGLNPWLLPPLMLLWVNLHPGFIYGLALIVAFTLLRPRQLGLPCIATVLATLANPWGWRVYEAIGAQGDIMAIHQSFIGEWKHTAFSWAVLHDAFTSANPDNAFWWLMALAVVGIAVSLRRKLVWGPLLLVGSATAALMLLRFHGLFVIAAAVILPDLLAPRRTRILLALTAGCLLIAMLAARSYELYSNHYYRRHVVVSHFGADVASWLPDRAAHFIETNHLPRELYADYVVGGYLTWRLPQYPVYIDGRALPYGAQIFFDQLRLTGELPEGKLWQRAIDTWKISTVLISTERFVGYRGAAIDSFCKAKNFDLVYIDDTAAVFVRTGTLSEGRQLPAIDCTTFQLAPPPDSAPEQARYHFWANAAHLYINLKRGKDAEDAYRKVLAMYDGDPSVHLGIAGVLFFNRKVDEAEKEYLHTIAIEPTATPWHAYGDFLGRTGRPLAAMEAIHESIIREAVGYKEWLAYGEVALAAGRPQIALDAAQTFLATTPYKGAAESLGVNLRAEALTIEGNALLAQFKIQPAIDALREASKLSPSDRNVQGPLQAGLAGAYIQLGRMDEARAAFAEAQRLGTADGVYAPTMQRLEWQLGLR